LVPHSQPKRSTTIRFIFECRSRKISADDSKKLAPALARDFADNQRRKTLPSSTCAICPSVTDYFVIAFPGHERAAPARAIVEEIMTARNDLWFTVRSQRRARARRMCAGFF